MNQKENVSVAKAPKVTTLGFYVLEKTQSALVFVRVQDAHECVAVVTARIPTTWKKNMFRW